MAFTTEHGASESVANLLAAPRLRVNGLELQTDGSYAGGTTARGLLWLLSPYAPPD
jgi:hypothetical protein